MQIPIKGIGYQEEPLLWTYLNWSLKEFVEGCGGFCVRVCLHYVHVRGEQTRVKIVSKHRTTCYSSSFRLTSFLCPSWLFFSPRSDLPNLCSSPHPFRALSSIVIPLSHVSEAYTVYFYSHLFSLTHMHTIHNHCCDTISTHINNTSTSVSDPLWKLLIAKHTILFPPIISGYMSFLSSW